MTSQPALFAEPARRPPTWTHTTTRSYLYFDVRDAPDAQDGRTTSRRIIRPTHVEILTTGTTANTIWILGPSVRRNGTLGATQTRTYQTTPDPRQPEPPWLAELLAQHDLTFPRTNTQEGPTT